MTDPQEKEINQITIKLLNQGSHGCIYRPEIKCDSTIGSSKYISKIQLSEENVKSEMEIGNIVQQKIKDYIYYFAPLLETCPVSLKEIPKEEKDKCEIFETNEIPTEETKYISTKIRYVGNQELEQYLLALPQDDTTLIKNKLLAGYKYLCWGLQKLANNDIIHFDIKEKNIVYDATARLPIIIDFGISFIIDSTLTPQTYHKTFYTKKYYPYWCFDIYLISNIIHTILLPQTQKTIQKMPFLATKNTSLQIVEKIYDSFYLEFNQFARQYMPEFTDAELLEAKKQTIAYYAKYNEKPWEELIKGELRPEIYRTWDHYSLAFSYLIMVKSLSQQSQTAPHTAAPPLATQPVAIQPEPPIVIQPEPPIATQPVAQPATQPPTIKGGSSAAYHDFTLFLKQIVLSAPDKRPQPAP